MNTLYFLQNSFLGHIIIAKYLIYIGFHTKVHIIPIKILT